MESSPQFLQALRLPEVEARTGYRKSTIYELEAKGEFPRRVKLGPRATAWYAHEVDAWLAGRPAVRKAAA